MSRSARPLMAGLAILLTASGCAGTAAPATTSPPAATAVPATTAPPTAPPTATPAASSPSPAGAVRLGPDHVDTALAPGTYEVAAPFGAAFSLSLPTEWTLRDLTKGDVEFNNTARGEDGSAWLVVDLVENVFVDPCHATGPSDPPVAKTVDEVVEALTRMTGYKAGPVSDVMFGTHAGKALEVTNTIDTGTADCTLGTMLPMWTFTGGSAQTNGGATEQLWVVDVDGTPVIIDGETFPNTPSGSKEEIRTIVSSLTFTPAASIEPGAAAWATTGPMADGRANFGLVVLGDGTVLAAGGASLATAERFDPASGIWMATGNLHAVRSYATTTLLHDGTVLVAGGGADGTESAERYDPSAGAWVATGDMVEARGQAGAVLLDDGLVLEVGGGTGYEPTAETYDPATGRWTATGPMVRWRASPSVTLLADGRVLVAGGFGTEAGTGTESSAELYDPATRSWTATAPMSAGRVAGMTATPLPDGRVLLVGGVDGAHMLVELFDPTTDSWSTAAPGIVSIGGQTATLLRDGTVLIAGGFDGTKTLATSQTYDATRDAWAQAAPLVEGRVSALAVTISTPLGDRVLVAGGSSSASVDMGMTSAELYGPIER